MGSLKIVRNRNILSAARAAEMAREQ